MQPVGPLVCSCAVRSHILSLRRVRNAPSVDASNGQQSRWHTKLQVDVVGLDLTALIDMWQVVKES